MHIPSSVGLAPVKVLIPRLPSASAILPRILGIDARRFYTNFGPLATEFEEALKALVGAAGVTLTCNGTIAIELALRARSTPGRRLCLMPAFTFIASAHAVCNAGLEPFLLDVDPGSLALTPEIVEAALPSLAEPPAAVLVVSAFGAPPDLKVWAAFESRHGIPVVFDAAAAVTSLSDIGAQPVCVSLHATKVLGIGEGGAIFSSDLRLIERLTAMTGFGFMWDRISEVRGGNYRISEYTAAIGLSAVEALPARQARLREVAAAYRRRLRGKESRLQPGVGEAWVTMTLNVTVPSAEAHLTTERFDAGGIDWRRWWGLGCHRHPAFADVRRADLSITEALAVRVIGVPFHDDLTEAEIDRVVACLR
jgi:dTDP-4-amino-4,6-dideoxygalactose transaminase